MEQQSMTLIELFGLGGWAMWPLLVFSIAAFSLIIERLIFMLLHNLDLSDVKTTVLEKINQKDIKGALEHCESAQDKKLGAKVIAAGIRVAHLGEHRMEKALAADAAEKINMLERGFNFMVAIGSLAPITGFLGTVSGMISAFQSIANAADVNAQLVAGGIFEALITTAFGLAIALVAIAGYNIFAHFVDKFIADVEDAGSEIVTSILLTENNKQL
ncbi:MAG: MotA/TolQ/ExbB proton channel family protein [Spirochaetes bacterium]|nr:MotA/TolQ/ExbB proton channel family protein [Spirochaetota bacterium]